ncbi:3227_t:CDS:2, partial [Cetraspora pellucida]
SFVQVVQNKDSPFLVEMFQVLERIYEHEVNNKDVVKLNSKKASYAYDLGLCKKALDIAIISSSNEALEDLLQGYIDDQILLQSKSHLANKRYLSAIKNHGIKNVYSNNQEEILASGSMKKTSDNVLY